MHLAYFDVLRSVLFDHDHRAFTQHDVKVIAAMMAADVAHDEERNPPLFVAWSDSGPDQWIGVFSLDGEEVQQITLDRIEQLAKGYHLLASVPVSSGH